MQFELLDRRSDLVLTGGAVAYSPTPFARMRSFSFVTNTRRINRSLRTNVNNRDAHSPAAQAEEEGPAESLGCRSDRARVL